LRQGSRLHAIRWGRERPGIRDWVGTRRRICDQPGEFIRISWSGSASKPEASFLTVRGRHKKESGDGNRRVRKGTARQDLNMATGAATHDDHAHGNAMTTNAHAIRTGWRRSVDSTNPRTSARGTWLSRSSPASSAPTSRYDPIEADVSGVRSSTKPILQRVRDFARPDHDLLMLMPAMIRAGSATGSCPVIGAPTWRSRAGTTSRSGCAGVLRAPPDVSFGEGKRGANGVGAGWTCSRRCRPRDIRERGRFRHSCSIPSSRATRSILGAINS